MIKLEVTKAYDAVRRIIYFPDDATVQIIDISALDEYEFGQDYPWFYSYVEDDSTKRYYKHNKSRTIKERIFKHRFLRMPIIVDAVYEPYKDGFYEHDPVSLLIIKGRDGTWIFVEFVSEKYSNLNEQIGFQIRRDQ